MLLAEAHGPFSIADEKEPHPNYRESQNGNDFECCTDLDFDYGRLCWSGPADPHVPSAALQRLNQFQASNRVYAANRELGRALKTEFVRAAGPAQGLATP